MGAKTLFLAVLILSLGGCAAAPRSPDYIAPDFSQKPLHRIALAPVFFADAPLDRRFGLRAAEEIRWHVHKILRSKGYDVVPMDAPSLLDVPRVPEKSDLARLAPPPPSGTEGIMVIRIDHFLDAGLYDRHVRSSLDIYATAALISPEGTVLWIDQGVGRGSALPSLASAYDLSQAPAFLAESLFATLPGRH